MTERTEPPLVLTVAGENGDIAVPHVRHRGTRCPAQFLRLARQLYRDIIRDDARFVGEMRRVLYPAADHMRVFAVLPRDLAELVAKNWQAMTAAGRLNSAYDIGQRVTMLYDTRLRSAKQSLSDWGEDADEELY